MNGRLCLTVSDDAVLAELPGHLFLQLLGLDCRHVGEVRPARRVDDAARRIDDKAAVGVHPVAADFFKRAALGTDTRHEQEVVGRDAADVGKEAALRGAYDVHHTVCSGPLLRCAQYFLEQPLTCFVLGQLEVVRTFVAGQRQEYDPFPVVAEERGHAVLSHVGSHCQCVEIHLFEERAGIHGRRVADVAAFGVGNDELLGIVLFQVADRLFKGGPAFQSSALVKGEVRLVGDAVGGRGVDDSLVEGKDGVVLAEQVGGYFLYVRVEADAEERRFPTDVLDDFLSVHVGEMLWVSVVCFAWRKVTHFRRDAAGAVRLLREQDAFEREAVHFQVVGPAVRA